MNVVCGVWCALCFVHCVCCFPPLQLHEGRHACDAAAALQRAVARAVSAARGNKRPCCCCNGTAHGWLVDVTWRAMAVGGAPLCVCACACACVRVISAYTLTHARQTRTQTHTHTLPSPPLSPCVGPRPRVHRAAAHGKPGVARRCGGDAPACVCTGCAAVVPNCGRWRPGRQEGEAAGADGAG